MRFYLSFLSRNKTLISVFALFFSLNVVAQDRIVLKNNFQWFQYYTNIKLNENFSINADGGIRFIDGFSEKSQYVLRTGLGYHFNNNLKVAAGLAHLGFFTNNKLIISEIRPYQEILHRKSFNRIQISNRFRAEQRFFHRLEESNPESYFNHRFRYLLMFKIHMLDSKSGKQLLYLSLGNEVFFNLGERIDHNYFAGNRFLFGPGIYLYHNTQISLLYNNQWVNLNRPEAYSLEHVFWLRVIQNFGQ